jgi:hypothetical protein
VSPAVFKKAVDACKDLQPPGTCGCDRVAALRLAAVVAGEPHVHVLACKGRGQSGASSRMLFVRALSVTTSTTRASCQVSRRRIAALVMGQLDPAHPLRALPEVEMGDEQPGRSAVLGLERLVLELVCDPRLAAADVVDREVVA